MADGARVVVVDDEPDMVENCTRFLRRQGYRVFPTTDAHEALALVESEQPDVVLTDFKMPGLDGLELLRRIHLDDPGLPVIMITAFATIEAAVAAVRAGSFDYLPKNFTMDHLAAVVERAVGQRRLQLENRNLRDQLRQSFAVDNLVGRSAALVQVLELVRKAARSEANILVLGESGTGKELIARAVHANSPRAAGPFMPIDCASLPENLLESELFGHEKGAFTGAIRSKPGLMETAHRGTVFLDEIGELPPSLQVKLLRALQERQIRRVGGSQIIDVDVRVVSATNRDLRDAIARGQYREELYYRVNVIEIRLPPLRERQGDVPLLAQTFLKRYGEGRFAGFEGDAMAALEAYAWPGNVRELQNIVERACALGEGERIARHDLPDHVLASGLRQAIRAEPAGVEPAAAGPGLTPGVDLPLKDAKDRWMQVLEGQYLKDMLARHDGNISAAAKAAGIDRKTFHRLVSKYNLR